MENKKTEKRSLLKKIDITKEQVFYLLIADVFYALALNLFYVGNKIAAGGFAGIATVINAFIPIPVGTAVFLMSIPVVIVAWKVKGATYTLMALATTAVYSIIVDVLSFLPTITDDMIVAVVCGGIFYGLGASMAIKAHMSSGGTDLLGKVLDLGGQSYVGASQADDMAREAKAPDLERRILFIRIRLRRICQSVRTGVIPGMPLVVA